MDVKLSALLHPIYYKTSYKRRLRRLLLLLHVRYGNLHPANANDLGLGDVSFPWSYGVIKYVILYSMYSGC